MFSGSSITLTSNNITTTGTTNNYGILISTAKNNFSFNIVNNSGGGAIRINSTTPKNTANNTFANMSIISIDNLSIDLDIATAGINYTYLFDTYIRNYSFSGTGSIIYFRESVFGEIGFLNQINGSGGNLSHVIRISNNSAIVNTTLQQGFNKSANVTLYNISTSFANPAVYKDGELCSNSTIPACYNLTNFKSGTAKFNVTEWSTYSISEGPDIVPPAIQLVLPTETNVQKKSGGGCPPAKRNTAIGNIK